MITYSKWTSTRSSSSCKFYNPGHPDSDDFIGGGTGNLLNTFACYDSIVGGCGNSMSDSSFSGILGGCDNSIAIGSNFSAIGGGCHNTIGGAAQQFSFIGGGCNNTVSGVRSFIGGGGNNVVNSCFAAVLGGNGNIVSGDCSSIIGGANNNDGGLPFTSIFGNGLTATVAPATMGVPSVMWVDELVVPNIPMGLPGPVAPGALPAGALWYYPDLLGNKVVYVA